MEKGQGKKRDSVPITGSQELLDKLGNLAPPPLFLEQTEAQRTEKTFVWRPPPPPPSPLSKGLDDRPLLISRSGSGTVKNR